MKPHVGAWARRWAVVTAVVVVLPVAVMVGPAAADDGPVEEPSVESVTAEDPSEVATGDGAVTSIRVRYAGEPELEEAAELELPVEVSGGPRTGTVEIAVAVHGEDVPVAGTVTVVGLDVDGAADAVVAAGALAPGSYVVGLVQEGVLVPSGTDDDVSTFVVTGPAAPDDEAAPSETTAQPAVVAQEQQEAAPTSPPADVLPEPSVDTPQEQAAFYSDHARALFDADGDGVFEIPTPRPGSGGAGLIPAGLEAYYTQDVDLSIDNCDAMEQYDLAATGYVECGYVVVPMDAKDPSAGNLALAVARGLASGVAQGSMLLNPGGPGGEGLWMATMGASFPELDGSFDFIGFDPRGVGVSVPYARCIDDEDRDAQFNRSYYGLTRSQIEELAHDDAEAYADDCFANTGAVLGLNGNERVDLVSHLGTWDAVGDLDIIRSVLGDTKLNYLGYSYGTQLGYVYAQKFPQSVGRMVLDAAVDPMPGADSATTSRQLSPDEQDVVNQIAGFQDAFEQFARDCSTKGAQPGVTWADAYPEDEYIPLWFGAPYATYGEEILDSDFSCPLGDGSIDTELLSAASAALIASADSANGGSGFVALDPLTLDPESRRLVSGTARTGIIQALYSQELWSLLAYSMWELTDRQEGTGLLALADLYNGRNPDGSYGNGDAAFTTIRCTDTNVAGVPFDVEAAREFAAAYDDAAPFQASESTVGIPDYCDFWRFAGTLPAGEHLTSVPNILVISTSHDSATPYAAGVKLAQAVDGTLLSVAGASHGASGNGLPCVDDTVSDFLRTGSLPDVGPFGPRLSPADTALMPDGGTIELTNRCQLDSYRPTGATLSRDMGRVGDRIEITLVHLASEAGYTVAFDDTAVESLATDNGGNDDGTFAVPTGTDPGRYTVTLVDTAGVAVAEFAFRVIGEPGAADDGGRLPDTGAGDAPILLLLAAGLLVSGAALALGSRRLGQRR